MLPLSSWVTKYRLLQASGIMVLASSHGGFQDRSGGIEVKAVIDQQVLAGLDLSIFFFFFSCQIILLYIVNYRYSIESK